MRNLAFLVAALACIGQAVYAAADNDMEIARLVTIEQVDDMSGQVFETYVCHLLTNQGYKVKNIRATNDFGVDATATRDGHRTAIQIKRSDHPIDRSAVSDAIAGKKFYKCSQAMVVTNSRFTASAREFAAEVGCRLVEREELLKWIADFKRADPGATPRN